MGRGGRPGFTAQNALFVDLGGIGKTMTALAIEAAEIRSHHSLSKSTALWRSITFGRIKILLCLTTSCFGLSADVHQSAI